MNKKFIVATILACHTTLSPSLFAQVIPGINSKGGAMVVPEGKLKMAMKHIYFQRKHMFDGSHEVTNKENLDATANITLMVFRYGIVNNGDIRLMIPYKRIDATAKLGPNNVAIDNSGIGDIAIIGKYVLLPMKQYGYQVAVEAGVKFPTGKTDKGFKKAPPFAQNIATPLPTQPGTGGAEYKFGLGFSKILSNTWRVDAHTMYTYRPKAKHDYDFGNEITFDIGTTKAITKNINIGLEYNFKYNSKTNMGNDTNPILRSKLPFKAFSGSAGYITPQIEFLPFDKPKLHIGVGVSFLAHYNLKEYQPLEKRRVVLRIGYLF
ncbi:transporter [Nitratiruptor tergarcus]|uniref:Putative MetA-pathway of phenol degradation n=1 Tax=Nitratiruptor tergarcus DSM 16512 TaxID=1069081 RepID=A0A1W1WSA8_9BACT|nr:transporter [Nitratiruptor tergarcus]SMC09126.1 Putative MetA-pathway of phenol degradation [Nitratiruptor tergarcus DSM 16512]